MCSDAARLGMRSQDQPLDTVKVADKRVTDRSHDVISKQVSITLWDNGALYSSWCCFVVCASGILNQN